MVLLLGVFWKEKMLSKKYGIYFSYFLDIGILTSTFCASLESKSLKQNKKAVLAAGNNRKKKDKYTVAT